MAKKKPQAQRSGSSIRWEVLGLPALMVLFYLHARQFDFIQDDAFITFRYIQNFISGNGLVWNIGEKVEGYTTFLWTMLLAVPGKLGFNLIPASQVLGVICAIGALAVTHLISRTLTKGIRIPLAGLIAVALLAANGSAAYWAISGMETAFFMLLLTVSVWLYVREQNTTFAVAPFAFVLLTFCRPEGMYLFALTVAYELLEMFRRGGAKGAKLKQLAIWCLLYGVPVGIFMIWRYAYYGWFFPNTYYAKAGISAEYFAAGIDYFNLFAGHYLLWGALLFLPALAVIRARMSGLRGYLGFLLLAYTVYVVTVGGDVLPAHRFFVPVLPLLYLLVQEGVLDLAEFARKKSAALVSLVWLGTAGIVAVTYVLPKDYIEEYWLRENGLVLSMADIGLWLRAHARPGTTMAGSTIGAVGYYSELPLIDMLGLTDETIAHHPERIFGVESGWRERNYNVSYVLSRKPEWILFSTGIKPSAFAERGLFTRDEFRRWYYPYYFHPSGNVSEVRVLYRRSDEPISADTSVGGKISNDFINQYYEGMNRARRWPKEAMDYFQKSAAIAPANFGHVYEEIGNLHIDAKNTSQAMAYYGRALAADPRLLESRKMLGAFARSRGNLQEARGHFELLVKYQPEYSMGWTMLGETQAALGEGESADRSLTRALNVARNNQDAARLLRQLRGR